MAKFTDFFVRGAQINFHSSIYLKFIYLFIIFILFKKRNKELIMETAVATLNIVPILSNCRKTLFFFLSSLPTRYQSFCMNINWLHSLIWVFYDRSQITTRCEFSLLLIV